jgi:Sulfotransferase family
MTQVLCITGMHRSGTSLAASWLQRCDLPIADGRLLGPGVGNPRGHFEDLEFSDLQDGALRRAHGSWRATEPQPLSFNAGEVEQARLLVARRNDRFPRWGWKDPRTILFLHHWKRVIPDLKVLILWRPCAEVVDSLRKRGRSAPSELDLDISVRDAVRVWRHYNTEAYAFTSTHPDDVILAPIQSLIVADGAILEEINRRWRFDLPYAPIDLVRDDTLLTNRPTTWSRLNARLGRAKRLEQKLLQLSWPAAVRS